jgi:hypothetical protein
VAILVPLKSGSGAALGQAMVNAAHVALDVANAPALDALDTGGTPAGAADAARMAIQHGDRLIIGPLTAGETAAVAPIAKAAGVPVLAFTSDPARAEPGVWTMGLTPAQQINRLVGANLGQGKRRFAAALPNNPFGDALAQALTADPALRQQLHRPVGGDEGYLRIRQPARPDRCAGEGGAGQRRCRRPPAGCRRRQAGDPAATFRRAAAGGGRRDSARHDRAAAVL